MGITGLRTNVSICYVPAGHLSVKGDLSGLHFGIFHGRGSCVGTSNGVASREPNLAWSFV